MCQRKATITQPWTQPPEPSVKEFQVRSERRGASHAMARAVSLHLDGKPAEALNELYAALDRGEKDGEIYSSLGHIHFQLGQYNESANSYWKLLQMEPTHRQRFGYHARSAGQCQQGRPGDNAVGRHVTSRHSSDAREGTHRQRAT